MELCCQCVVPSVVPSMVLSVCGQVSKILLGHFWRKYPFFGENGLFCSFFSCFQVKKKIMRQVLCLRCKDKPENIKIKYFLKKVIGLGSKITSPTTPFLLKFCQYVCRSLLTIFRLLSVSWDFWYYL